MFNFDEIIDRKSTPSAKFHSTYLKDIFGTDQLYPFWVADMDFKIPPTIQKAFAERIDHGVFGYELKSEGFMPAVTNWFKTRYHIDLEPDWILFTPTIMSSVAMAIDVYTDSSNGVIILPPVYMDFANTIKKTERKIVEVPLQLENLHYKINFDSLRISASDSNNRILLLSNPHNPGGRVWNRKELQMIVNICIENDLILISDEIHADIIFSNGIFTSLLDFPEIHSRLVVCYSPGKVFNIASVTDSMAIIPDKKKREEFRKLQQRYNLGRTNAFSQVAMEVGFESASEWVDTLVLYIEGNHNYIKTFTEKHLPQIDLVKQEGTYLVWLKVDQLPLNTDELVRYFARDAQVGLNNGNAFGKEGDGYLRMNIACPRSIIVGAMDRILAAVENLTIKKQP